MDQQRWKTFVESSLRHPIPRPLYPLLQVAKVSLDLGSWIVAVLIAAQIRWAMVSSTPEWGLFFRTTVFCCGGQLLAGIATGLYRQRRRYSSFEEVALLVRVTVFALVFAAVIDSLFSSRTPLSALLVGGVVALLAMMAVRYVWRAVAGVRRRPEPDEEVRLLVFGAGDRGCGIVDELVDAKGTPYVPVGLIDDDRAKRKFTVRGVHVLGTLKQISVIAAEYRASALLVAVSDVSPRLMQRLLEQAEQCDPPLKVKVLSPISSLFGEKVQTSDIQDLSEEDLLGRRKIDTDMGSIADYIRGKRVLVTGAGGSIGSELCRQLHHFHPERLVMLDRDESALQRVQLSIEGRALLDTPDLVLADLRDHERIMSVFADVRPHVVFHAAALKHLTLLEANPEEALKSNIWGTQTVLDASQAVGVHTFVNISTDKAASPSCVLGYSKRIAERLTSHAAQTSVKGTYVSVRFGNVLGSQGSVLTTFRKQVEEGNPLTVTHPDITRYFMLIEEAVQLVIQAGAIGQAGEVLVLDMGEPVRIADVAQTLIRRSGRDLPIVYTGMRAGEKMHEDLLGPGEDDVRPTHPLITQASVPALAPKSVESVDTRVGREALIRQLHVLSALAPTDQTNAKVYSLPDPTDVLASQTNRKTALRNQEHELNGTPLRSGTSSPLGANAESQEQAV